MQTQYFYNTISKLQLIYKPTSEDLTALSRPNVVHNKEVPLYCCFLLLIYFT